MPIPRIYKEIIQGLLEATRQGRINWVLSSNGTVAVGLPELSIKIWGGHDDETKSNFVSFGISERGESKPLDSWFCEDGDQDFALVSELFEDAKRKAKRIDERLEALNKLLKDKSKKLGDGSDPDLIPF